MMTLFFTDKKEINNYEDAMTCDLDKYAKYFKHMLDMGIYLPPSQFECCFLFFLSRFVVSPNFLHCQMLWN